MILLAEMKSKKGKLASMIPEDSNKETTLKSVMKFEQNLLSMYHKYKQYSTSRKDYKVPTTSDGHHLYLQWMEQNIAYEDVEKFAGVSRPSDKSNLKAPSLYQFFNALYPYEGIDLKWNFRFEGALIRRLKSGREDFRNRVFYNVFNIARGYFSGAKLNKIGPLDFMSSYSCAIEHNAILVFCILPERVPIISDKKVVSYRYNQYIRFMDIAANTSRIQRVLDKYFKKIADHPDMFKCFQFGEFVDQLPFAKSSVQTEYTVRDLGCIFRFVDDSCKSLFFQ